MYTKEWNMMSNSIMVRPKDSWLLKGLCRYPELLWGGCGSSGPRFWGACSGNIPGVRTCIVLHWQPLINPSNSVLPLEQIIYNEEEEEDKVLEFWVVVVEEQDLGGRLNETCLCTLCSSFSRWMVEPAVRDAASMMPLQWLLWHL